MEQNVVFVNKGLIDLEAIANFGVNVKETPDAYGYFGTGLKFAIAVLIRTGHKVTLFRSNETYLFLGQDVTIRDRPFQLITMHNVQTGEKRRLGFTTELGKTWKVWQAWRELYCNCLDESGEMFIDQLVEPQVGLTKFVVLGSEFRNTALHADQYAILHDESRQPVVDDVTGCDIFEWQDHEDRHALFYKGIRAYYSTEEFMYKYNIRRNMELSEDRTIKWNVYINSTIAATMMCLGTPAAIEKFLTAPADRFEYNVSLPEYIPSGANVHFRETLMELGRSRMNTLSPHAKQLYKSVSKAAGTYTKTECTERQAQMITSALKFLESHLQVHVTEEIVISPDMHDKYGSVHNGTIVLGPYAFEHGFKQLVATIYEEYLHITQGFEDESRKFQDFLILKVIDLAAELQGEII